MAREPLNLRTPSLVPSPTAGNIPQGSPDWPTFSQALPQEEWRQEWNAAGRASGWEEGD